MTTLTLADFKAHPRKSVSTLRKEETVLSVGGKPVAMLIPLSEEHSKEAARALILSQWDKTLGRHGTSKLSMKKINAVIADVRAERRRELAGV